MRFLATFPLLISLVAAACDADALTSVRSATRLVARAPADRSAIVSRPISGRCALTTLATDPYPAPPVFRQVVTGECKLSHLGDVDVRFVQVVNFATRTQRSLELVYIAPNGDILYAASAGANAPNGTGVSFSAEITFVGGTGRFANANGQAQATGAANIAAGTSEYVLDGWIAYDAASGDGK
jgi:hypothetical protein